MTVSTTASKAFFNGNGSIGPFQFTFPFYQNSWIVVTKADPVFGATTLTENVDYYLTGANSPNGGSITLVNPLAIGQTLLAQRIIPLTQPVELQNFGAFFAATHEEVFDVLTMMIQQVNDISGLITVQGGNGSTTPTTINIDASAGPVTVDIKGLADVVVSKDDSSTNVVTVMDSSGNTIERLAQYRDGLSGQDETVHLILFGGNWKKI